MNDTPTATETTPNSTSSGETTQSTPPQAEAPQTSTTEAPKSLAAGAPKEAPKTTEANPAEQAPDALTAESLTLPEGFDSQNPAFNEFVSLMNDPAVTKQDMANRLIEMYANEARNWSEQVQTAWLEANNEWQEQVVAEFGEEKLEKKLHAVGALIDAYDKQSRAGHFSNDPAPEFAKELRAALDLTGAGNHPAVLKFLFWTADKLGEGKPLTGMPAGESMSRAQKLYGT